MMRHKRVNGLSILVLTGMILATLITCEKPERIISFITLEALEADISYTTATLKGEIIDAGSQPVDEYGIIYSTDPNPRIGNGTPKSAGTSLKKGEFSITVTGLTKNARYYFRAYVIIDDDEIHADKIYSFTTKDTQVPAVTAGTVTEITMTSASLNGEVTSDGGETSTIRGLCWGTSANPTLASCLDTTINGSGTGTFTGKISGLTPGTQYYARTYAINAKGTSYNSTDIIFKTHNLPVVTTAAVSGISGTGASSGGEVTDTGGVAVTARGVCWSTASGPTADLTTKTTDGPGQGSFTSSITGLALATTYYLRAYATNIYGTSYGSELTFSTLQEPGAVTTAATGITTTSATLNGSVNANNSETAVSFQYGTTTSYGSTIAATPGTVIGNTSTSISASLSSLTPGTTYHYRVRALSEAGEIFGADQEFTTLKLPSAATLSATTVTGSTATLNGTVNANNSATTVTFEYGLTTAYGTEAAALQSPVTGTTSTAVSADLTGLTPGQEYHYRVKAVSAAGTAYGDDKTMTTSMTSAATTNAATAVGNTTATLNGIVNAAGSSTTVSFEYGTSTSYGTTVTALQSPVTGTANTAVSAAITGLTPGLTYHFRVKAVNAGGTTYGSDLTFTTLQPPAAATSAATAVSSTSATLNGTADANNSSTTVTFEYGATTSYGTEVTADQSPVTGDAETSVSKIISGLSASTTYHYRVKAVSAGGTVYGNDAEFTTSADLPTVSDYEGNIYNIITIGTQEWMQKNLMVTHYSTGDAISNVTDNTAWSGLTTDAFCWYNNDQATYKETFGALYNWYTVIDVRNVCPAGWHVPTDAEWTTLTTYLGGISAAGGKLKESGTAHWASPNEGATNETGFTALPGGNRYFNGAFEYTGSIGDWWSFTGTDATMALSRGMYHHIGSVSVDNHDKRIGFSIRCLKGSLPLSGTISATAVSSSSVTLNGKINPNDASTTVTFEYGTTTAYGSTATASQSPVSGTTPVDVSAGLSGLTPATEYHYRVKAVNPGGTSYGSDLTFTTASLSPPAATSGSATGVSSTSAVLNGMVNANGLSTAVTFEYGTSTSYGTEVAASESPVSGSSETPVSVGLSGLTPSTTYHYRVKAVSAGGTAYGDDKTFTTSEAAVTVTDREGNIYITVLIGTQRWMAENLKTTVLNDGTSISLVSDQTAWSGLTTPGYCWLDNDQIGNKDTYGALYNWHAVNTGYLCPTGWHVPSDDEFTTLVDFVGGATSGGGTLKETGTVHWLTPNTGATNNAGFTGLPGGVRYDNGIFALEKYYGYWWSTTEQSSVNSWYRYLYYNNASVGRTYDNKNRGKSVRCIEGELPFAETKAATAAASTSVTLNGNVYANGASTTVTFEYGTTTAYGSTATASQSPVSGTTPVDVSIGLTGLTPGTEYHYRVKAVNSGGTSYGGDVTFSTSALPPPTATTESATAVASTSATMNGTVNANDVSTTVTFEYGETTAYGAEVAADQSPVAGTANTAVSKSISGLTASTTYHYRVKAVSAGGTTYGDDKTFSTSASIVTITDYEGNIYNTVLIGTQRWMAENLKATKLNDGTSVPVVTNGTDWDNLTTPGICFYNNDETANKDIYGVLYNWYTVNTGMLCPTGWHIPTDAEWTILTTLLGGEDVAGGKLKEAGTAHWASPNTGATDEAGFTALPGGYRMDWNGPFYYILYNGLWWSATEYDASTAYLRRMFYDISLSQRAYDAKGNGLSARCIQGELPFGQTKAATAVASTSVTLNGNVYANGASTTVTYEYGTSTSYGSEITASQSLVSGTTPVDVSAGLSGLSPGTEYHYRVKAVNSGGTSYGSDKTFTTPLPAPEATTGSATAVASTSATLNGTVNANDQSTTVTFEYGETTSYGTEVTSDQSPVNGNSNTSVSKSITGLSPSTTYHYRVKAVSAGGTMYGEDMIFATFALTDYDGNSYNSVQIGSQIWMAENLKTTKLNDGTSIPEVTDNAVWGGLATPAYCFYENNESLYKDVYGIIYNWYSVGTGKLCPAGWHVPTYDEFLTLQTFLGGISIAGGKIKETGETHWLSPNTGATNESGFTGLPAGYRSTTGLFQVLGQIGIWHTSTPVSGYPNSAWHYAALYNSTTFEQGSSTSGVIGKKEGCSIRCLKD